MAQNLVQALPKLNSLPLVLPELPLELMPVGFPLSQTLFGLFLFPFNPLVPLEQPVDFSFQLYKMTGVHGVSDNKNLNFQFRFNIFGCQADFAAAQVGEPQSRFADYMSEIIVIFADQSAG